MLQNFRRIFKWGIISFIRNGTVAFSSILVLVIALLMIGSTMLINEFFTMTLKSIEDKIDINVYFSVDAAEEEILSLRQTLEKVREIALVTYTSKEQALEEFKARHENDELTIQALKELEDNPFRARFNIKAISPDKYDGIAILFEKDSAISDNYGLGFIDKVNYRDNKLVIERMNKIIEWSRQVGFVVTIVLIAISILITYNTIRLVIYISKDEIGVMRLVGASNMYIRGPFIIAGTLYGIVAALITTGLFYPITLSIKRQTEDFYGGIDLFKYYVSNFTEIFIVLFVSGMALGAISSLLVVRKYLKK